MSKISPPLWSATHKYSPLNELSPKSIARNVPCSIWVLELLSFKTVELELLLELLELVELVELVELLLDDELRIVSETK